MNISLTGDTRSVAAGLKNLLENYRFKQLNRDEFTIEVDRLSADSETSFCVSTKNGLHIEYKEPSNFFRALSVLLRNSGKADFEKQETALFEGCSTMIDLSRNAVYTVAEMKRLLCYMALAGFNRCYLYMEDTYELPGYPYFGYLRGRYSLKELKEIDDFADSLGIEAIPCIQTLAHLQNTLKWGYADSMKDTEDILLVGEEKTYQFIEAMISTLKNTFRSNKIHIGMDEAMGLGTGVYLQKNGYKNQYSLMIQHLTRVNEIIRKYGMTPMIWDDMFYRSHDSSLDYYNAENGLTDDDIAQVPDNIVLVYWDYYHNGEEEYDKLLAMRDRFPNDIIFAGGIWRWTGYVPPYSKTFATTNAALSMCKKHKVKEIMATAWGDNGSETPIETILPGLVLFGEHCFGQPYDEASIEECCTFLTGVSLADFRVIEQLDLAPDSEYPNLRTVDISKQILYQDLLMGAFDPYLHNRDLAEHYTACEQKLSKIAERAGEFQALFTMYARLAKVLAEKVTLGIQIREHYKMDNRKELSNLVQIVLPRLKQEVQEFKDAYAKVWFHEGKGYGFEVIDVRLGGLMGRIDTVAARLTAYLNGDIPAVEELEEILLPYCMYGQGNENYICLNQYHNIVTQNVLG